MIEYILIASSYTVVQEIIKCKNVIVNEQMAATMYIAFFVRWYLRSHLFLLWFLRRILEVNKVVLTRYPTCTGYIINNLTRP